MRTPQLSEHHTGRRFSYISKRLHGGKVRHAMSAARGQV
ncbi:MAG: hypothetical protein OJF50_002950 [Nitrospira sp.]|nr:hypothetical protein [Nitrospira sp.]